MNKKLVEFFIFWICNADRRSMKAKHVTVEDIERWYNSTEK